MGTDGDPTDDDDALLEGERYQGVRDLFRQAREGGFDEDPPARIDALLMAAARQHAPEPKAGAFERLRRWLVGTLMQPAVAGAVAIAVIGGTAGVLYMKGKGGVAEPTVSRPEHASAPDQPAPTLETTTGAGDLTITTAPDALELRERLRELEQKESLDRTPKQKQRATEREDRPKLTVGGGEGGGTFDYKPDERDTAAVITTDPGSGDDSNEQIAVGGVKTQIESPQPPPDGAGASADEETVAREVVRPSRRAQAENLLKQARTAARNKDCNTVRTMAKRAKQLDSTYYTSTFSRDAALKDCLSS